MFLSRKKLEKLLKLNQDNAFQPGYTVFVQPMFYRAYSIKHSTHVLVLYIACYLPCRVGGSF